MAAASFPFANEVSPHAHIVIMGCRSIKMATGNMKLKLDKLVKYYQTGLFIKYVKFAKS